ncbi:MAG: hypothetical protein E7256_14435, partial [Lachnospiraceae bacterium]|nr:hypothetical protein [Lachnospiraceae bacterium]
MKKIGIWLICLWMFLGFGKTESVLAEEIVLIPLTKDYTVTRDALSENGAEMLFQVLKDGQPMAEQDMMKMDFQFIWHEAGRFQSVVVEYGKNGMISVTPLFEVAKGGAGKALKWLTAFMVSSGSHRMQILYREPSGLIKTQVYYFTVQKESLKVSLIYGMIPFFTL